MTGGVRTKFFLNAPKYDFPEGSPYEAARDILEPILAGRTTDIFLSTLCHSRHAQSPDMGRRGHHKLTFIQQPPRSWQNLLSRTPLVGGLAPEFGPASSVFLGGLLPLSSGILLSYVLSHNDCSFNLSRSKKANVKSRTVCFLVDLGSSKQPLGWRTLRTELLREGRERESLTANLCPSRQPWAIFIG